MKDVVIMNLGVRLVIDRWVATRLRRLQQHAEVYPNIGGNSTRSAPADGMEISVVRRKNQSLSF